MHVNMKPTPDSDSILSPLEANLEINTLLDNVEEVFEDRVGFTLRYTNDAARKAGLDVESLPACHRMCSHNRVHMYILLASNCVASFLSFLNLLLARMDSEEGLDELLVLGRKTVVCCVSRSPEGIASHRWQQVDLEECDSWGLQLVAHVRVPAVTSGTIVEELARSAITYVAYYQYICWKASHHFAYTYLGSKYTTWISGKPGGWPKVL